MSPEILTPEIISILMFAGLLVGVFLGFPVAFVMISIALIIGLTGAGPAFLSMTMFRIHAIMVNYIFAAVPLFIFMGVMLEASGAAERLFTAVQLWLGPLRGGLAITVVVICTLLAATTGIVGAAVTIMGIFALPILLKKGYDKALSTGTICAAGTLGILIPPSVMLVIYGPMAGISIIRLFAGAIIPGLVLSSLYMIYILIRCYFNPKLGPPLPLEERMIPLKRKLYLTLTSLLPPLFLILAVLGAIFFGIAAVTEAAAVGAFASMILCAAYGKLNWQVMKDAASRTLVITVMIMFVAFAAYVFAGTFILVGGGKVVTNLLLGLPVGPTGILVMMLFAYFILGFFMDWIGIVPILVPLFSPVVAELGFDPVWFAILACVCMQTSFLTPPMASALFYMKGVAPKEIDFVRHIIGGIIPYIPLQLLGLALVAVFPQLALWLPSLLGKVKR